jgi:TonB-linked SusC/RagA family outer membrane protein
MKKTDCIPFQVGFKKILRIMKLTAFIVFILSLQVFAKSFGQTEKVSLSMNSTFKQVIERLEEVSGYRFVLKSNESILDKQVDVKYTNESIEKVLNDLLKDSGYTYNIVDRYIAIRRVDEPNGIGQSQPQKSVSGKVTDSTGGGLPGVSVVVKGTTTGTITDFDGNYTLANVPTAGTLVFSFVGMKSQEVTVGTKTKIDIQLAEETVGLEEVVAVGYGTQKKSDLTGSVARVSMDKNVLSSSNVLQALSGTVAGMNVAGSIGEAGADPTISIRGQTSLSASDAPLIVIDGIIYNGSISNINTNDVESIDILKDASSAAVYGSRSANGVMIITTKKGKSQKPVISFSGYNGIQDLVNNPVKVMNGEQYAVRNVDYAYQQSLYAWYATNPTSDLGKPVYPDISDRNYVALRLRYPEEPANYLAGKEIDWIKEVTQIAQIQEYNVSISGKADKANYFISGSYTDENGIQKNDKFKRFTFRSNLESDITDWLKVGFNSSFTFRDYSGLPASLSNAMTGSPWANNHIGSPVYDIDMCQDYYQHYPFDDTYVNDVDTRNNRVLTGRAVITVPWVKGLTYEFNYSNTMDGVIQNTFAPVSTRSGQANFGYGSKSSSVETNWILNNIISYNRTFLNDHRVSGTLLYSREKRSANSTSASATQFANPTLGFNNLSLGGIPLVRSSAWEEQSVSYMARLNYTYKNRYFLTGTVREDGFSGFGADNKFATFPSLSVAWVTSDEPFFKNLISWLYLKERISWGRNGNQGIGRYSSFSRMTLLNYVFDASSVSAIYPSTLGNSSLKWESTSSLNFGIDWGLFDRRINGSIEIYTSKTNDVLVQRSLPTATGYSSVWANIGQIANKGVEFTVTSKNLTGKLKWETNFVFATNKDKIVKLYGNENDADIGNSWFVGESISAIYDYEMVDGTVWTEEDLYSGKILSGWYPGQFKLVDQNKDGVIDPTNDRKIIGYRTPLYRFSINNTLSYKNFTLTFSINSIQGGKKNYLENNSYYLLIPNGDQALRTNQFAIRQYWTPDNGVTNASGMYSNPRITSGLYQSRSFVRLQDVTLSYSLNESILKKLKVSACQFYVASKNPYVWTKWQGFDPEVVTRNPDPLSGLNAAMRNITVGLKFTL